MKSAAKALFSDSVVGVVLGINAIVLFWMCFPNSPIRLLTIDHLCTSYFFFEVTWKLCSGRVKGVLGWGDYIIVMICTITMFTPSYSVGVLILLRLLRAGKLVRALGKFRGAERIMINLKMASKAAGPVCIGMFWVLLILDIVLCSLYSKECPEYFGDPWTGMFTTFRLFTIEGWYEVPEAILANTTGLSGVFGVVLVCVVVFVCSIMGIAFITSTFTDELAGDNDDKVMKKLAELEEMIKELKKKGE